ncbi:MAG: membrane protein insertase YidC [Lysobacter sp.]|nr:MAG: membrane protein insertase YidC [Lysobacter sp.]
MNQTRVFLLFAWLMVAGLLWMEWAREKAAPAPQVTSGTTTGATMPTQAASGAVPTAAAGAIPTPMTPAAPATAAAGPTTVSVRTDVLDLVLDGGQILQADLAVYPDNDNAGRPVRLFATDPQHYFAAQAGWIGAAAPTHLAGFVPAGRSRAYQLAPGAARLDVPFVWHGPNGVSIRRTYTFTRGGYAVAVRDDVINAGATPWEGSIYRQLSRVVPPAVSSGPFGATALSFQGAAWYSPQDKYEKRKFENFIDDGALTKEVAGGWIAMLQHHFFSAWIPEPGDRTRFETATPAGTGGTNYVIREVGPAVRVAPGMQVTTQARLWIGPKAVEQIQAQKVAGLERAVDFSKFDTMAAIAGWLYAVLAWLHSLFGNWGWSIVGLVVIIKTLMLPLSVAQYRSMAKMRKLQPKLAQLRERYGEDRQQYGMAQMELFRKEKVNPMGGCLPLLVQMPVFLALYWMLSESVELRHAPWIGWIRDLTARDPFFVLPALNMAVTWATQRLTPTAGMDPMQAKMMQFMPLVFGIMFAFFPAGLVLYWVTNGLLTLLQQWWFMRYYSDRPAAKA